MKNTRNTRKVIETYLSKKLDSKEFSNILDRGDTVLNIDKLISDLKLIRDIKILILYCYNFIELIITFGLREHLFKNNVAEFELNHNGLDFSRFILTQYIKQCTYVADDILDGMRFERKKQYAARIFYWDKNVLGIISDFQQLRNLIAHKYHIAHREYLQLRKDKKSRQMFQHVLFNKRSVLKNMIYLLRVDFIPSIKS